MRYELLAPPILLILFVITFLTIGFYSLFKTRRIKRTWLRTKGVVIDLEAKSGGSVATYSPVVRFAAHDGKEVQFTEKLSSYPPRFKRGQEVEVFYHPHNFNHARVWDSNWLMYYTAWLMLGLGGVFLLIGILAAMVFGIAYYYLGAPGQR